MKIPEKKKKTKKTYNKKLIEESSINNRKKYWKIYLFVINENIWKKRFKRNKIKRIIDIKMKIY